MLSQPAVTPKLTRPLLDVHNSTTKSKLLFMLLIFLMFIMVYNSNACKQRNKSGLYFQSSKDLSSISSTKGYLRNVPTDWVFNSQRRTEYQVFHITKLLLLLNIVPLSSL